MHPISTIPLSPTISLEALPIFTDNWVWIIYSHDAQSTPSAWIVDPGEADAVIAWHQQRSHIHLQGILVTHKHSDHIGGITQLLDYAPHLQVIAPTGFHWPFPHTEVHDHEHFLLAGLNTTVDVLHVPGHTLEHVAYYLPDQKLVFCGDTLFSLGCGRMFEGTAPQFWKSLCRLRALPDTTLVACTHEYTHSNARFAVAVEPHSIDHQHFLAECVRLQEEQISTLPSTIEREKKLNPFLRCDQNNIKQAVEHWSGEVCTHTDEVFARLREWKNQF